MNAASITVARTMEEVERLRPVWGQLRVDDVDADIDFLLTVVDADSDALRPHVVLVAREGQTPLMVVARVVRQRFSVRVGYRPFFSSVAQTAVIPFTGVLGCGDEVEARVAIDALLDSLEGSGIDAVLAQKVAEDSIVWPALARVRRGWRRTQRDSVPLRFTDLPASWEAFLAQRSAKSRRQIRYDENRVRKTLGSRMELRRLDQQVDCEQMLDHMQAVARHSYQHAMGLSIVDNPVQHALIDLAARKRWLRVWMLYVDGAPVAFWWGILYRGVLTIMTPGFLPSHAADRVGHYTFMQMFKDLCDDPEANAVNYGPGDAGYKQRFGTRLHSTGDVLLSRATPAGLLASLVVTADVRAHRLARRIAASSGRGSEIKKRLRR